jgi:hypothetical protein
MLAPALLEEMATVLPYAAKPAKGEIAFHRNACAHCNDLRKDLEQYQDETLPDEAIRNLHNEWSCGARAAQLNH